MSSEEVKEKQKEATLDVKEAQTKDYLVPLADDCQQMLNPEQQRAHFENVGELSEAIAVTIGALDTIINALITQVEDQIVTLKTHIIAVDHILPEDELKNSQVVLMNTSKEEFLSAFADGDAMENTLIGKDIRNHHIHATLSSVTSIHGVFPLFPLGSSDPKEADEHYTVLSNLGKLANRNTFHVYFSVDVPRIATTIQGGQITPLERYSDLAAGRHKDIVEWMNDWENSPFYQKFKKEASPKLLRRVTALFNPYIGHTETLESNYLPGKKPDEGYASLLDTMTWVPPSAFMAQRLVTNYERLGWCGGLFGLLNSAREIPGYNNPSPQLFQKGLCCTKEMDYRYGVTLYNFLMDREGQRLIDLGLTAIQRQTPNDQEWVCLTEAQTLLPQPENYSDNMDAPRFLKLSKLRQEEFRAKATQKMYNYLGNCLIEDTVNKGVILLCRKFIGQVGTGTEEDLRTVVTEYMTIFAGKQGANYEPFNAFMPALESYEIKELSVKGQTAFVTVKIRPVPVLRKVVLMIDMDPLSFDVDVDNEAY